VEDRVCGVVAGVFRGPHTLCDLGPAGGVRPSSSMRSFEPVTMLSADAENSRRSSSPWGSDESARGVLGCFGSVRLMLGASSGHG